MALSDIPNPTPIVIPAKEEKIFDKQFCPKIEINAFPSGTSKPWTAKFIGQPYNGSEVSPTGMIQVELQDLKALAEKDAELAAAMGAVLALVGKYLVKCRLKNKRIVTVGNIEEILE